MQLNVFAQIGWELVYTFSPGISSVYFEDSLNGFAFPSASGIYKTTDGGENWDVQNIPNLNSEIVKIIKPNINYLIGVGSGGTIIKSLDGGVNWEIKSVGTSDYLTSISSTIDGKLFVTSYDKNIFRSTDDGDTWNIYSLDTLWSALTSISFRNANIGFGVGFYNISIKTTDGGENWFTIPPIINGRSMFAIKFINESVGYTVGGSEIDKTTDGGITWIKKYDSGGSQLNDITTYGTNFAWVAGSDKILHTRNTGESWYTQTYTPYTYLTKVECVDSLISFVIGEENLYKTTDGGGGSLVDIEDSKDQIIDFELSQNFPNPFNPTTTISYQLPTAGNIIFKVYDVLGNEVVTLVNEYRPAGSYEIEFKSTVGSRQLANGVYFYRLQAGDYVETKKMILLK